MLFLFLISYNSDVVLMKEAIEEAIKHISIDDSIKNVYIYSSDYSSSLAGDLILSTMGESFLRKGKNVYIKLPDYSNEPYAEISFSINEARVIYYQPYRKLLLGEKMIKRRAIVSFTAMVNMNKKLQKTYNLTGVRNDVIPYKLISFLSNASLADKTYNTNSNSLWEPLIISSIVVLMIYIFYAPE